MEREEPVLSLDKRNENEVKEFREYIVKNDVLLAIVKCT